MGLVKMYIGKILTIKQKQALLSEDSYVTKNHLEIIKRRNFIRLEIPHVSTL